MCRRHFRNGAGDEGKWRISAERTPFRGEFQATEGTDNHFGAKSVPTDPVVGYWSRLVQVGVPLEAPVGSSYQTIYC
jgi:hypothetical protein